MSTALQVLIDALGVLGLLLVVAVSISARAVANAQLAVRRIPVRPEPPAHRFGG